jgi:hypothetical protein
VWITIKISCCSKSSLLVRIECERDRRRCRRFGRHIFPLLNGCDRGLGEDWISSKHSCAFHSSLGRDCHFQPHGSPNLTHSQHGWIVRLYPRGNPSVALGILLGMRRWCEGKKHNPETNQKPQRRILHAHASPCAYGGHWCSVDFRLCHHSRRIAELHAINSVPWFVRSATASQLGVRKLRGR